MACSSVIRHSPEFGPDFFAGRALRNRPISLKLISSMGPSPWNCPKNGLHCRPEFL